MDFLEHKNTHNHCHMYMDFQAYWLKFNIVYICHNSVATRDDDVLYKEHMVILFFCVFSPVYTQPDSHFAKCIYTCINIHVCSMYCTSIFPRIIRLEEYDILYLHEFEYRQFVIIACTCSCTILKVQSVVLSSTAVIPNCSFWFPADVHS